MFGSDNVRAKFSHRGRRGLELLTSAFLLLAVAGCAPESQAVDEESVGETTDALVTSTPFGAPVVFPGGFLFPPNYDNGGEGVAYHDTDAVNHGALAGSTFRTNEGVDVEGPVSFPTGADHIGWTAPGEWLNYTIEVKNTGVYQLTASVAAPAGGASFHFEVNGVNIGTINVPNTGDWQTFTDVKLPGVRLNAGVQILRLVADTGGFNFRSLTSITSTPFGREMALVPGTVAAYKYDDGGEGLAYHDTDASDQGASKGCTFRTNEGVDVEGTSANPSAPNNVGWTAPGEWLNYTVDVLRAGTYDITASVAAPSAGSTFRLMSGASTLGTFSVPSTGAWTTFQDVTLPNISLPAGVQTLQVLQDTGGFNLASIRFAPRRDLIQNGAFAQGLSGWTTYVDNRTSPGTSVTASGGKANATIVAGAGYQEWYVQLYQRGLTLLEGQTYDLAFDVSGCSGSTGGRFNLVVEHDGAPYTAYLPARTITLPQCGVTTRQTVRFTMPAATDTQSRVTFNMGLDNAASSNTLSISNVSLKQAAFENPNLVGHIANADKVPMPGIAVTLSGAQSASTVTDGNGNYRFQVPAGAYTVSAAVPANSTIAQSSVSIPQLVGDMAVDFACSGSCGAAPGIVAAKELVITDPSVLGDARASSAGPVAGPWSFRAMMEQLVPAGVSTSDFVEAWVNTFNGSTVVNGFFVGARDTSRLRALWPVGADGKLDLSRAPFQLMAIVNRVDVGAAGNGEARFVYGVTDNNSTAMTVIFEYGLPSADMTTGAPLTRNAWAAKFHALGGQAFGAGYNASLQAITDLFARRGSSPAKPGGSSINQVRTSENLMSPGFWQWREYHLTSTSGALALIPAETAQTPDESADSFFPNAASELMVSHLNTNPVLVRAGYIDVPTGVLGGASNLGVRFTSNWSFPGRPVVESARHAFAGMTCKGCHTTEAGGLNLDTFYIISPLSPPGADGTGRLAPFVKQVEIPRRQMFMQNRLSCSGATCAPGGEAMVTPTQ